MKHRSICCEGVFLIYTDGLPAIMLNAMKSVYLMLATQMLSFKTNVLFTEF